MAFSPKRLSEYRNHIGINKAEAARRLNLTPMGYGRYENGSRIPSYQMICYIASVFGTSPQYLCEETDDPNPAQLTIKKIQDPDLFVLINEYTHMDPEMRQRLLGYAKMLTEKAE